MADRLRTLTRDGLREFQEYLSRARSGSDEEPPFDILWSAGFSTRASALVELSRAREFADRLEFGLYLANLLGGMPEEEADGGGLWTWLALYYFDRLCPKQRGVRRVLADHRYVLPLETGAQDYRRYYRHLVATPFRLVRMHGPVARAFLRTPLPVHGDYAEQLAARQEIVSNRAVVEAADCLYYSDKGSGGLKVGAVDRSRPGNVRRLIAVMQQLDLTYDLYGMTADDILSLLPDEFDGWLAG